MAARLLAWTAAEPASLQRRSWTIRADGTDSEQHILGQSAERPKCEKDGQTCTHSRRPTKRVLRAVRAVLQVSHPLTLGGPAVIGAPAAVAAAGGAVGAAAASEGGACTAGG